MILAGSGATGGILFDRLTLVSGLGYLVIYAVMSTWYNTRSTSHNVLAATVANAITLATVGEANVRLGALMGVRDVGRRL